MAHQTPASKIVRLASKAQNHAEGTFTVRVWFEDNKTMHTVNAYFKGNSLSKCAIKSDVQACGSKSVEFKGHEAAETKPAMNADQFKSLVSYIEANHPEGIDDSMVSSDSEVGVEEPVGAE